MENTNKRNQDILRRQGEVLLPAIAYGDAAGLPVETRTAEYITEHHGRIDKLIPTKENPFYGSTEHPGMWSDDTQLSLAVAKALIMAKGFSLDALVETHLEAYDETVEIIRKGKLVKRGWGGSTTGAMDKLHAGVDPTESGTLGGEGNGVLMKMAPLVYWQVTTNTPMREAYTQLDQLTTMTHDSELARIMTRVHADVLGYLLRTEEFNKTTFLSVIHASLASHSFMYRGKSTDTFKNIDDLLNIFLYLDPPRDNPKIDVPVTTEMILTHTDKRGFHAPYTLAMAYGAFLAHQGEFTPSVFEAVNLGGDTDSIASIVATMSAFKTKEPLLMPIDHQNIEDLDMIKSVSRQLAATALGN